MPDSELAREAMADLLGALAHPDRLYLVEVLRSGPKDVATLAAAIGKAQPRTSQHLALLKAHHLVLSHREGRRVIYELGHPSTPDWIRAGLVLLKEHAAHGQALAEAVEELRRD